MVEKDSPIFAKNPREFPNRAETPKTVWYSVDVTKTAPDGSAPAVPIGAVFVSGSRCGTETRMTEREENTTARQKRWRHRFYRELAVYGLRLSSLLAFPQGGRAVASAEKAAGNRPPLVSLPFVSLP
jgi:hypothetical protein